MEKYQFDIDTAVTRIKDSDTGEALFASVITNDWHTGTHPNGGYLTSIVLNAMRTILPHPDPILASVYFFNPARPGPATVRIIRLKESKRMSTAQGLLIQIDEKSEQEVEILRVTATYSTLEESEAVATVPPPHIPPILECWRPDLETRTRRTIFASIKPAYDPDASPLRMGKATHGKMNAWQEFPDNRPWDIHALALACDGMFPAVANLGRLFSWVPTIQMTFHFLAHPKPGPLRTFTHARILIGDMMETDAMVYDSQDRLVATSRQVGMVLAPKPKQVKKAAL